MAKTNLDFEKNKEISSGIVNLAVCATELGKIDYVNTAQNVDEAYPSINGVGVQTFILQTESGMFTLRVVLNYVSQRLYYHIINQNNEYIIRFAPLSPWPTNLLTNNTFKGYYLFFQYGILYFGKLVDYEVEVEKAVFVDAEDLWVDYSQDEDNEDNFLLPDTEPKEITELSVSPTSLLMDLGKKSLINVKTNADTWDYSFKGPQLVGLDKETGVITAIDSGYSLLQITAQKEGCLASRVNISLYISTKGQISEEDKNEIIEGMKPTTELEVSHSSIEVEKGKTSEPITITTNAENFSYLIDEKVAQFNKEDKTIFGVEVGATTLQIGATALGHKLNQTSIEVKVIPSTEPVEPEKQPPTQPAEPGKQPPTQPEIEALKKLRTYFKDEYVDEEGLRILEKCILPYTGQQGPMYIQYTLAEEQYWKKWRGLAFFNEDGSSSARPGPVTNNWTEEMKEQHYANYFMYCDIERRQPTLDTSLFKQVGNKMSLKDKGTGYWTHLSTTMKRASITENLTTYEEFWSVFRPVLDALNRGNKIENCEFKIEQTSSGVKPTTEEQTAFTAVNNKIFSNFTNEELLKLCEIVAEGLVEEAIWGGVGNMGGFYNLITGDIYTSNTAGAFSRYAQGPVIMAQILSVEIRDKMLIAKTINISGTNYPIYEIYANLDRFYEYKAKLQTILEALRKGLTIEDFTQ